MTSLPHGWASVFSDDVLDSHLLLVVKTWHETVWVRFLRPVRLKKEADVVGHASKRLSLDELLKDLLFFVPLSPLEFDQVLLWCLWPKYPIRTRPYDLWLLIELQSVHNSLLQPWEPSHANNSLANRLFQSSLFFVPEFLVVLDEVEWIPWAEIKVLLNGVLFRSHLLRLHKPLRGMQAGSILALNNLRLDEVIIGQRWLVFLLFTQARRFQSWGELQAAWTILDLNRAIVNLWRICKLHWRGVEDYWLLQLRLPSVVMTQLLHFLSFLLRTHSR